MKRYAKQLVKDLTALGFDHIWTNTSGGLCYAHPDDPAQIEIVVTQGADERAARATLQRARRITGAHAPDSGKRNAAQARARAAGARDRERQRAQAMARLAYVRDKHHRLTATPGTEPAALTATERLLAQRESELDALERLMRQPPSGGHTHRGAGQARHYTGPTA